MATMEDTEMEILELPKTLVEKSVGIAIDFGSSVSKTVKIDKSQDYPSDKARLLLRSFTRDSREPVANDPLVGVLREYFDDYCSAWAKTGEEPLVHTAGIAMSYLTDVLRRTLNIRVFNENEFIYIKKALFCLGSIFSMKEMCHEITPTYKELIDKDQEKITGLKELFHHAPHGSTCHQFMQLFKGDIDKENTTTTIQSSEGKPFINDDSKSQLFPALVTICGSACNFIRVDEDGSFIYVDINPRAGHTLLSLGSLLVGTKTYEEFMSLASHGDSYVLHAKMGDVKPESADDKYSAIPNEGVPFCFSKAHQKSTGDFKREDLAAALLEQIAGDIAQTSRSFALAFGCNSVVCVGGLCSNQQFRDYMAYTFYFSESYQVNTCRKIGLHFLKHGQYYGAIGALLENAETRNSVK